uniref:Phlebovirus_G2 domain-containing protein n=1 Tax=Heterorhabditis bacteriophora TaxID=37862 RepID=A0A1I7XIV8_HETBA
MSPVLLLCRYKSLFFTRDHTFIYPSIRRCSLMDSHSNNFCETIQPHEPIAEFSNTINNITGFSYCMEACGCLECGCFLCTPACLFYRIIPKYTSPRIYEILTCSTYDTEFTASISLNINRQPSIDTSLVLAPGQYST